MKAAKYSSSPRPQPQTAARTRRNRNFDAGWLRYRQSRVSLSGSRNELTNRHKGLYTRGHRAQNNISVFGYSGVGGPTRVGPADPGSGSLQVQSTGAATR